MKYLWLIFLVCFSLYIYGLYNHSPVYHWKDPNITVKRLKSWKINGNTIHLVYIKNDYTNEEKLGFGFSMRF